ncbi:MAG TPA: hypothetical protein VHD35_08320 [Chitinophagaceae bacterium]|nr:hypothetical protein [Chitinophagaceae bacterium]
MQQGLLVFPDDPPSYCEVGLGKFEPVIKKEEPQGGTVSCHNPLGQNIITCRHPYRNEFVEEVGGLTLDAKLSTQIEELPFYIPVLDISSSQESKVPSFLPTVGVTLKDIILGGAKQIAGTYHEDAAISFRDSILSFKGFSGKNVILFLTGTDTLIETAWHRREPCKFFETIGNMGFWAVGGMNFSVFEGECAFSQALNQKRSLFSSHLIEENNVQAIPHVYAINQHHIERWAEWFLLNPSVKLFTINCQMQKSDHDISQVVTTVKILLRKFPYLHVLLQGFRFNEIYQFGSLIHRIHFADKMPVKCAYARTEILIDKSSGKLSNVEKSTKSKKYLLRNNITNRCMFLESLRNKILQRTYNNI